MLCSKSQTRINRSSKWLSGTGYLVPPLYGTRNTLKLSVQRLVKFPRLETKYTLKHMNHRLQERFHYRIVFNLTIWKNRVLFSLHNLLFMKRESWFKQDFFPSLCQLHFMLQRAGPPRSQRLCPIRKTMYLFNFGGEWFADGLILWHFPTSI